MREEADRVIAQEGWTKTALNSMFKSDSFLRESQRMNNNLAGETLDVTLLSVLISLG